MTSPILFLFTNGTMVALVTVFTYSLSLLLLLLLLYTHNVHILCRDNSSSIQFIIIILLESIIFCIQYLHTK